MEYFAAAAAAAANDAAAVVDAAAAAAAAVAGANKRLQANKQHIKKDRGWCVLVLEENLVRNIIESLPCSITVS